MEITPVIATLTAAGFGSLMTLLVAVVVQKTTLKRERNHKLWERQVAVFEESLRHERNLAQKRRDAMRDPEGDLFLSLDQVFQEADIAKISANLELYGSPEMRAAHQAAWEAFRDWMLEFIQWQVHNKRTGPGHEEEVRAEAVRETTKRWPNVEKLSTKAEEAHEELAKAMRGKAIFEPIASHVSPPNRQLPGSGA
ncbi:hypothetical protein ABT147_18565 [Streptomyces sp. NPDC001868]|uniref:hypothetical protein n=1 Tax=Streptomyces sp. NPDC001868 TaxID=3154401 RepID=UPI0033220218